jgi:Lipase (class 3)
MYATDPDNLMPEPTSDFPAGFRLAAWVQMQDFIILSTGPTFYGFLAQNIANPTQFVLAIRGTQTPEEWWDDFTSIIKTPFSVPNCGSVALGFNRIYQTMEIIERPTGAAGAAAAVRSLKPVGSFATQAASLVRRLSQAAAPRAAGVPTAASISVAGHSLGSALATLYTMENAKGDQIHNPILCTYASPRVGDANFVAAFSALPLTSWRIVNEPDIVPTQPPELAGFRHIGVEQKFDSSASAKASLVCWHAMATYLSLVDPARKPDPACRIDAVSSAAGGAEAAMAPTDAGVARVLGDADAANDGGKIADLLRIASDPAQLDAAQATAAKRLLRYDGEQYPSDGCAITLSVLLQEAGINLPDTFQAIVLGQTLAKRGWSRIPLGSQAAGDIGSTCFQRPHHGTDHIYLVLRPVNADEMVIADNQATEPHFRFASGKGKSPTQFFLRAPKVGVTTEATVAEAARLKRSGPPPESAAHSSGGMAT